MQRLTKDDPSITVSFEMPESMLKWLRVYASKQDRSVSWVMRKAISELKAKNK